MFNVNHLPQNRLEELWSISEEAKNIGFYSVANAAMALFLRQALRFQHPGLELSLETHDRGGFSPKRSVLDLAIVTLKESRWRKVCRIPMNLLEQGTAVRVVKQCYTQGRFVYPTTHCRPTQNPSAWLLFQKKQDLRARILTFQRANDLEIALRHHLSPYVRGRVYEDIFGIRS